MIKNMKNETFINYFGYLSPSILAKYLYKINQDENDKIASLVNNSFIYLKSDVNKKKIPENENPEKIISIAEKP